MRKSIHNTLPPNVQLLATLSVTIAISGCGSGEPVVPKSEPPIEMLEVDVISLRLRPWPTVIRSQGSLDADEQSVVGTKVAGSVAKVHVDLGDFVEAEDPLVELDQAEFRLLVAQAEAQLEQTRAAVGLTDGDPVESIDPENAPPVRQEKAIWVESKSTLDRAANLRKQDALSQGEYDQAAAEERVAEARYDSALNGVREKIALIGVRQAELSLARQRLQDAIICAPLSGYVQQRHVAPGSYLSVGQPIVVIVRSHPLRFRGTVPERHAQSLAVGQEVRLRIESVPGSQTAQITRVSPALDQRTRSLAFEAEIDNSDHLLRTGLFAEAEIVIDPSAEALVVPRSAVIEFAGSEKVWKVVDGVATEQEVLSGARRDQEREILDGLAIGDVILRDATQGRVAQIAPTVMSPGTSPEGGSDQAAGGQQASQQDDRTTATQL